MKPGTSVMRKVFYGTYSHSSTFHPVIRFGGKYLERLGFKIGARIKVEYAEGKITITIMSEDSHTN